MVVMGGPVGINSLLGLLITAGVVVPLLSAIRIVLILRGARARKDRGVGVAATYVGEAFLFAVTLFNTLESVLWVWNCVQELRESGDDGTVAIEAVDKEYLERAFWASAFYTAHLWALKGAVLSLYYDLIPTLNKGSKYLLYAVTAFVVISFQSLLVSQMLYCRPLATNWSTGPDFCSHITSRTWILISSGANISNDILMVTIPLCVISTLNLTSREHWSFLGISALSSLSIPTSVIRYIVISKMVSPDASPAISTPTALDADWLTSLHVVVVWTTIELLTGHICFCIPAFRVLIRRKRRCSTSAGDGEPRCVESRVEGAGGVGNMAFAGPFAYAGVGTGTGTAMAMGTGTGAGMRTGVGGGGGGNWFDYSIISPVESSSSTLLTSATREDRGRGSELRWDNTGVGLGAGVLGGQEDPRSWEMPVHWEEALSEAQLPGSPVGRTSGGWGMAEEIRPGEFRMWEGWMPVPSDDRTSSDIGSPSDSWRTGVSNQT